MFLIEAITYDYANLSSTVGSSGRYWAQMIWPSRWGITFPPTAVGPARLTSGLTSRTFVSNGAHLIKGANFFHLATQFSPHLSLPQSLPLLIRRTQFINQSATPKHVWLMMARSISLAHVIYGCIEVVVWCQRSKMGLKQQDFIFPAFHQFKMGVIWLHELNQTKINTCHPMSIWTI